MKVYDEITELLEETLKTVKLHGSTSDIRGVNLDYTRILAWVLDVDIDYDDLKVVKK
jgi:tagatose-1,6-bisphosphate aldolase non-catalytic subunit AgaZ/GatZ